MMPFLIKQQTHMTFQYQREKRAFLGVAMISLALLAGSAAAQNFPHIKTFGFDYAPLNNRLGEAAWLAKHHDWIIGGGNNWDTLLYNTIKEANPDTKVMRYLAYHSMAPNAMTWMENWARSNGYDPEDIYYHYHTDSEVRTLSGSITVPGFGNGSAASLEEARARVRWNGGWVGINPSSTVFRRAFEAYALYEISVAGSPNTFLDGVFLDTFDGIQNSGPWTSNLQNTIELNPDGSRSIEAVYNQVQQDLLDAKMELEAFLKQQTGNNSFVVNANAADADIVYQWFPDLYVVDRRDKTMHLTIEYMVTSTSGRSRIPRLRDVYDDLENGRQMLIRSQTNVTSTMQDIPYGFTSFILAAHYLINHENAYFMYHEGSAANYGGTPYGNFRTSHWHRNMEVNIGVPITRVGTDSWGASNTDRFYELSSTSGNTVLARDYSNALVLAKFGRGGLANIGNNPATYQLGGSYYPLLEDNSTGAVVTSVTLGESEGIILLKNPVISTLPRPQITSSSFEISQ